MVSMRDGCCWLICFFFFFKQKTAYEMRISDWSSDVCSSDLAVEAELMHLLRRHARRRREAQRIGVIFVALGQPPDAGVVRRAREIGRASCRERVCQYV